jgi:hypothetical protein
LYSTYITQISHFRLHLFVPSTSLLPFIRILTTNHKQRRSHVVATYISLRGCFSSSCFSFVLMSSLAFIGFLCLAQGTRVMTRSKHCWTRIPCQYLPRLCSKAITTRSTVPQTHYQSKHHILSATNIFPQSRISYKCMCHSH